MAPSGVAVTDPERQGLRLEHGTSSPQPSAAHHRNRALSVPLLKLLCRLFPLKALALPGLPIGHTSSAPDQGHGKLAKPRTHHAYRRETSRLRGETPSHKAAQVPPWEESPADLCTDTSEMHHQQRTA